MTKAEAFAALRDEIQTFRDENQLLRERLAALHDEVQAFRDENHLLRERLPALRALTSGLER